jgi:hypothetical protein
VNKLLALIAVFFVSALHSFGQLKPLVAASTLPTTIKFEGYRNFALPSFCDEKGNSYVKLLESGMGMAGPIFRISEKGLVEAEFDTTGTLGNTFAARPNGGIATARLDGKTKVIDNFGPDGKREAEVRLEQPPIPFFPMQIAVFPSGGILLAGSQYRASDQASTAVYDHEGHLIKQLVLEGDAELEHAIPPVDKKSSHVPLADRTSISRSVAITGDDGNVYLLRATSPPTVYAISSTGEVVRKIVVQGPTGVAWPKFGIRVIKNRLVVEFYRECSSPLDISSCKGTVFSILDASTGRPLVNYALEETAGDPIACYAPEPDRFFMFQDAPYGTAIEIVESVPK